MLGDLKSRSEVSGGLASPLFFFIKNDTMSLMLIYLDNCCYNRPFDNQEQVRTFFQNAAVYVGTEHFDEIKKKRDEYMARGIKMKDATHLASAVVAGCRYFLTTDDRFIKHCKDTEIVVCNPITFLELTEGETNA
jgi:predicted nucleic-acid-binding protein